MASESRIAIQDKGSYTQHNVPRFDEGYHDLSSCCKCRPNIYIDTLVKSVPVSVRILRRSEYEEQTFLVSVIEHLQFNEEGTDDYLEFLEEAGLLPEEED